MPSDLLPPPVFRDLKDLRLPADEEWLWPVGIHGDETLRAACLHEYVRENETVLQHVTFIDKALQLTGRDHSFCQQWLDYWTGGPEHYDKAWLERLEVGKQDIRAYEGQNPLRVDIRWIEAPSKTFAQHLTLVQELETLAKLIYPLSPVNLLERNLKHTPFFSVPLSEINLDAFELKTKSDEYEKMDPTVVSSLQLVEARTSYFWTAVVNQPRADIVETERPVVGQAFEVPSEQYFKHDELETEVSLIACDLEVYERWNPSQLARLALKPERSLPDDLRGKMYRLRGKIVRGRRHVQIVEDHDGLRKRQATKEEFIMVCPEFPQEARDYMNSLGAVARLCNPYAMPFGGRRSVWTHQKSALSVRADLFRDKKKSRDFYLKAIRSLSNLRMGHTLNGTEYQELQDAMPPARPKGGKKTAKNDTQSSIREIASPYVHLATVQASLDEYLECAKRIFPLVDARLLTPRTCKARTWTITKG